MEQEEINNLAKTYLELQSSAAESEELEAKFRQYQNICMHKLRNLVLFRARRYKKFSNYDDLAQDGFEALLLALKTYNPDKGCFSWWADKYINTRICRAANAHSVIRIPLKKARKLKPFKMSKLPIFIDHTSPLEDAQEAQIRKTQQEKIGKALEALSQQHSSIIKLVYGLQGRSYSTSQILEIMSITKSEYTKLLKEAKAQIKKVYKRV